MAIAGWVMFFGQSGIWRGYLCAGLDGFSDPPPFIVAGFDFTPLPWADRYKFGDP